MALNGRIDGTYYYADPSDTTQTTYTPYLKWSVTQDVANNRSTMTVTFGMRKVKTNSSSWSGNPTTLTVTVNETTYTRYITFNFKNADVNTDHDIVTIFNIEIPHNADGTKSVSVSASHQTNIRLGTGTVSGTAVLDTIVRGKPTATLSVSPYNTNPVLQNLGYYVQGLSKINYTITGTPDSSSSSPISNYEFVGNGQTLTTSQGRTNNITLAGTITVNGRVKDSRGVWSNYATQSITVRDYSAPKFTSVSAYRCDSGGVESNIGEYIRLYCVAEVGTTLDGNNQIDSITYSVQNNDTSSVVDSGSLTSGTALVIGSAVSPFSGSNAYTVSFVVTDTVGGSFTRTISIPKTLITLHLQDGGDGVAFGMYSNKPNSVQTAWDIDVARGKKINFWGTNSDGTTGSPKIEIDGANASIKINNTPILVRNIIGYYVYGRYATYNAGIFIPKGISGSFQIASNDWYSGFYFNGSGTATYQAGMQTVGGYVVKTVYNDGTVV